MIALFDIGGTHTRVAGIAASDPHIPSHANPSSRRQVSTFAEQNEDTSSRRGGFALDGNNVNIYETPANFDESVEKLAAMIKKLTAKDATTTGADSTPKIISGAVPGVLSGGKVLNSPHLSQWNGRDVISALQKYFPDTRIILANDAALACLGEATYGAGKGRDIVAYMTVSTGIGGCRVVRGNIDSGAHGLEPGWQIIGHAEPPEILGELVSGSSIVAKYGKHLSETDPAIRATIARNLAIGIHNSIVHWSPDVFVLGGSIILEVADFFEQTVSALRSLPEVFPVLPEIKKAALGDFSGLYGAFARATFNVRE